MIVVAKCGTRMHIDTDRRGMLVEMGYKGGSLGEGDYNT